MAMFALVTLVFTYESTYHADPPIAVCAYSSVLAEVVQQLFNEVPILWMRWTPSSGL
jgi:hypothetical protein